jgi:hypothetical protein
LAFVGGIFLISYSYSKNNFIDASPEEMLAAQLQGLRETSQERSRRSLEEKENEELKRQLCRVFTLEQKNDLLRWVSALPDFPKEVQIIVDENSNIREYRCCVKQSLPLWTFVRVELRYSLSSRR